MPNSETTKADAKAAEVFDRAIAQFRQSDEWECETKNRIDRRTPMKRPEGSNADEWHLFLCEHLANSTNGEGFGFVAVQIAEAIDDAERRGASA